MTAHFSYLFTYDISDQESGSFSIACETIDGDQYKYISFNLGSLIATNKDSEVLVMKIED